MAKNFETGDAPETTVENSEVDENADSEFENDFDNKWSDDESKETSEDGEADGHRKIKCIREDLEGKKHPETGVPYERKTVVVDGEEIEGVFPQFESKFDAQLPEDMYKEDDNKQFAECTKQLKEAIEKDPELANKFTERQYDEIMSGAPRISGHVWHHSEEPGKMQLVKSDIHYDTRHTGGRAVWGGGSECR